MGCPDLTNRVVIGVEDRSRDGNYQIAGDFIYSFLFEVKTGDSITIHSYQFDKPGQSFSFRCWISSEPNGIQLFERFHPGSGGIYQKFYDKNIVPAPEAKVYSTQRNEFSGITFEIRDNLVPLEPGFYYFNAHNLERLPRIFHINLITGIC